MTDLEAIDARVLERARDTLDLFVRHQAALQAGLLGFAWEADPSAPADYDSLQRAYARSFHTKTPLLVSSRGCDTTLYRTSASEVACRFWHNTLHVVAGRTFSGDDELAVGSLQLEALRGAGFGSVSLEHRLLQAVTVGRSCCLTLTGCLPADQLQFAVDCVRYGLEPAIELAVLGQSADA